VEQGARVASSQSPYGCTVHQTACKEGITKMDKIIQVAGIDVSKDKLDVHILASNHGFTVGRDKRGLSDLAYRLRKAGIAEVAVEASGGYEREVIEALEADGLVVHLLNPTRVRRFAEAIGILAKTDPIGARLIALYCRHFPKTGLTRRPEKASRLGEFLTVRSMLLKTIDETRNRLEHLREPALRGLVERALEGAKADLKAVDAGIARVIEEDEEMRRKAESLRSMIGVGPVLSSQTGRRQAALLCGVALADKKSGKSRRRSSIAGGRDGLRPILHMVALAAIRSNPTIAAFARKLAAAGKPKRLVIAACSRKIVVILNAMLRDQTQWQNPKNA
jgi:transposase